jgi:hypothetical protein
MKTVYYFAAWTLTAAMEKWEFASLALQWQAERKALTSGKMKHGSVI